MVKFSSKPNNTGVYLFSWSGSFSSQKMGKAVGWVGCCCISSNTTMGAATVGACTASEQYTIQFHVIASITTRSSDLLICKSKWPRIPVDVKMVQCVQEVHFKVCDMDVHPNTNHCILIIMSSTPSQKSNTGRKTNNWIYTYTSSNVKDSQYPYTSMREQVKLSLSEQFMTRSNWVKIWRCCQCFLWRYPASVVIRPSTRFRRVWPLTLLPLHYNDTQ